MEFGPSPRSEDSGIRGPMADRVDFIGGYNVEFDYEFGFNINHVIYYEYRNCPKLLVRVDDGSERPAFKDELENPDYKKFSGKSLSLLCTDQEATTTVYGELADTIYRLLSKTSLVSSYGKPDPEKESP